MFIVIYAPGDSSAPPFYYNTESRLFGVRRHGLSPWQHWERSSPGGNIRIVSPGNRVYLKIIHFLPRSSVKQHAKTQAALYIPVSNASNNVPLKICTQLALLCSGWLGYIYMIGCYSIISSWWNRDVYFPQFFRVVSPTLWYHKVVPVPVKCRLNTWIEATCSKPWQITIWRVPCHEHTTLQ